MRPSPGIILVSPCFSTFTSLVYLKLFSTSQRWAVRLKAKAQSDVTSSSCLLLIFLASACLCWSYDILDANADSRGHPSSNLSFTRCTWTCLFLACHSNNLRSTSAGKHLSPVYFGKQVYFMLFFVVLAFDFILAYYPHNLHGMSKGIFESISNDNNKP